MLFGEEVKRESQKIWEGVERSKKAGMNLLPLVPSDKACRFCKARGTCPALLNAVQTATAEGFTDLTCASGLVAVDPTKLGHAMDLIDLVEIWSKGVQAATEMELLAGRPVIGKDGPYKLVQGRAGNRKWTDEELVEQLFKSFRLKKDEMYNFSLISPTDAEKLLKKEFPQRWEKVEVLYEKAPGAKHVAKATDKRPALIMEDPMVGFADETETVAATVEDCSDLM